MQICSAVKKFVLLTSAIFMLGACTSVPEGVTPVKGFDVQQYLGTWYEIARLDHSFEEGLERVSANYSMRDDGGIAVLNKGYNPATEKWEEAQGKAYFVDQANVGHLKVSFFGPFYASYVVADLDANYQYALVTGPDTDYMWILSRDRSLPQKVLDELIKQAKQYGFNTDELIFVNHIEN